MDLDQKAARIIERYAFGSVGTMIAIPVPGADMAATYVLWGRMIHEIAKVYGVKASMEDSRALAAHILKGVILTTAAWFASAKTASTVLKFIPFAGTATAYLVDATIAGFGARKITAALGFTAAAYYKSGRTIEPTDVVEEVKKVLKDPKLLDALLHNVRPRGRASGGSGTL